MSRLVLVFLICLAAQCLVPGTDLAYGYETVTFRNGDEEQTVNAKIMVEAQDGGLMLCAEDGHIWTLQPEQILSRESNDQPLVPITDDEMERRLLAELGDGFSIYRTQHYVVAYNSSEVYARQVAAMYEQLYRGFFTYWKNQYWKLPEPEYPLVSVVLRNHDAFMKYATKDIGETAKSVIGYYHLASNRMITFNVPDFERNVSTIIHEATHQLAYNCGLQARFADNPMWVSEGLATFFEAPDRRNPTRWRNIGRVNQVNLLRWRRYAPNRPSESLATLLADDQRFRSPASAASAYAECWALTYFLIKTRRKEYVDYLRTLSTGRPLAEKSPKERIELFEEAFDTTLAELDKDFVTFLRRVR
ncbi:MAG: DUF1570 domain-containing protein [Planctomycetota bacterium]|nr:DUF1570 domain-containing protein [Planctomycetota bacterium]